VKRQTCRKEGYMKVEAEIAALWLCTKRHNDWQLQKVTRGKEEFFPEAFERSAALPKPGF
jgi:hypothetical protein